MRWKQVFSYTVTGSNYQSLGSAGRWSIDYHERLHREGDLDEARVSWKQKDAIEDAIIAGSYDGKRLTSEDIIDLFNVWKVVDGAYHDGISGRVPGQKFIERIEKKGLPKAKVDELWQVVTSQTDPEIWEPKPQPLK